jgi:hypothetical protein
MLQGLLSYAPIEWSVVGVHLIISAISFGLMVWFLAEVPRSRILETPTLRGAW